MLYEGVVPGLFLLFLIAHDHFKSLWVNDLLGLRLPLPGAVVRSLLSVAHMCKPDLVQYLGVEPVVLPVVRRSQLLETWTLFYRVRLSQ